MWCLLRLGSCNSPCPGHRNARDPAGSLWDLRLDQWWAVRDIGSFPSVVETVPWMWYLCVYLYTPLSSPRLTGLRHSQWHCPYWLFFLYFTGMENFPPPSPPPCFSQAWEGEWSWSPLCTCVWRPFSRSEPRCLNSDCFSFLLCCPPNQPWDD